jgi:putative Holliday junction resolvase
VGDEASGIVSPAGVIERPVEQEAALVAEIERAAKGHDAEALVVGLPLNMDGSEGPRATLARALGERIGAAASLPVHFFDERLTSVDADWAMSQSGLTHKQKKARRDALAAAAILRDFLASRRSGGGESEGTGEP